MEESDTGEIIAACRALHAAIDALDQRAAEMLGISRNDLRCLNLLEEGPRTPKALAQGLGLTSGSVTSLLDRLEAKGLVQRQPNPADRRGLLVSATPRVFQSVGTLYRDTAHAIARKVQAYAKAERQAAARHLRYVAEAWRPAAED